jgi:very-short-patch-repair endonuclease
MKRPLNRYQRGLLHLIKDIKYVECPYCDKKFQFLHWKHLTIHNKTVTDVRTEFKNLPTMTKKESERRSIARKSCNEKIIKTCEKKYGGVGFSSDSLDKKTRDKIEKKYGHRNIMKTIHGKKYFKGDLNPLRDPEIAKKVSETLKGRPSSLKGKTYEEILGEEKAEIRKQEQKINGQKGWLAAPRISAPQKELFKVVKQKYPTAVMEYPIGDFCLDIAVPELKLCFEYDGSYWHQDQKKDKKRDEILKLLGWKVTRFMDDIPSVIY